MSLSLKVINVFREATKRSFIPLSQNKCFLHQNQTPLNKEHDQVELDDLYKKIRIEISSHDPVVLESYLTFLKMTSDNFPIKHKFGNILAMSKPRKFFERWTLLKDRFSKRKHMRQYEIRTYSNQFICFNLTGSTRDTFLEYIQRNLPEGVSMQVHSTKILPLPEHIQEDMEREMELKNMS